MAFEALKQTLEQNGFTVTVCATGAEAAAYLNRVIDGTTVRCGSWISTGLWGRTTRSTTTASARTRRRPGERR